jgi:hypothetical protein
LLWATCYEDTRLGIVTIGQSVSGFMRLIGYPDETPKASPHLTGESRR